MDFSFPKEYQLFRRIVREFWENEVRPLVKTIDREHRVPHETVKKAAKLGLMGVPVMNAETFLRPARHRLIHPLAYEPRDLVERRPCRVSGGDVLWNLTRGFRRKIFSIVPSAARFSVSYQAGQYRDTEVQATYSDARKRLTGFSFMGSGGSRRENA